MTNSPHADNARERTERLQAEFDATYGPDAQTACARRNRVLLKIVSIAMWLWLVFAIGFAIGFVISYW